MNTTRRRSDSNHLLEFVLAVSGVASFEGAADVLFCAVIAPALDDLCLFLSRFASAMTRSSSSFIVFLACVKKILASCVPMFSMKYMFP